MASAVARNGCKAWRDKPPPMQVRRWRQKMLSDIARRFMKSFEVIRGNPIPNGFWRATAQRAEFEFKQAISLPLPCYEHPLRTIGKMSA